ncbi:MAG TPA: 6-pyruvoyl tetrahydropterin synthase family protein [Anaerolineae bacterium]
MDDYRIRVEKDYTVFSAAHFITYDGHECEELHGHNYRVAVSLFGDLDTNAYVFNFVPLKRAMRGIVSRLDHKLLLPQNNPFLILESDDESVCVTNPTKHKRYVFPRADVVLLPIPNTTSEMLATYICGQLHRALSEHDTQHIHAVEVEVEESFGQKAVYREEWNRDA